MLKRLLIVASCAVGGLGLAGAAKSQDIEVNFALPARSMTFASVFVAEDLGLFGKEGLKVTIRDLAGVASANAVLAGSAHFMMGTAPVFLRASAKGQSFYAIANLIDKPLVEMVLRKDVAEKLGITDRMSIPERAKLLKGLIIGIQGVGSIVHAWERYVVAKGGLDIENDVRIAPMDPPAMLPALKSKQIDGFATSIPFTTQAVVEGEAVMLASSLSDAPELTPFAYGLVYTTPETCKKNREMCARMARAFAAAGRMIQQEPERVFNEVLVKRFPKMDATLLRVAWDRARSAHATNFRVTDEQLENSQKVDIIAKLLGQKDAVKSYSGLYTDEFLK